MNPFSRKQFISVLGIAILAEIAAFFTTSKDWRMATNVLTVLSFIAIASLIALLVSRKGDRWFRLTGAVLICLYFVFWIYVWWDMHWGKN